MRCCLKKISIGSPIKKVKKIEPATSAIINKRIKSKDNAPEEFVQHIILKDGLLKITYGKSKDTYEVSALNFYDDFKEEELLPESHTDVYDYTILPSDYPD